MRQARNALAQARRVAVLTGAGMSAESGIPTFREAQTGLWSRFDPLQLASPEGFRADPALVWRWYAWRRETVARATPNAGHVALAQAAGRFAEFTLITQNVDGLHQRAGSSAVVELHGNIVRTICSGACGATLADPATAPVGEPPRCPACGAFLRPDVVWFGEMLPPQALAAAESAARRCELMLVIGTSGLVYPAAALPLLARRHGAVVVIINPQASELDNLADIRVRGTAGAVMPLLLSGGDALEY